MPRHQSEHFHALDILSVRIPKSHKAVKTMFKTRSSYKVESRLVRARSGSFSMPTSLSCATRPPLRHMMPHLYAFHAKMKALAQIPFCYTDIPPPRSTHGGFATRPRHRVKMSQTPLKYHPPREGFSPSWHPSLERCPRSQNTCLGSVQVFLPVPDGSCRSKSTTADASVSSSCIPTPPFPPSALIARDLPLI